MDKKEFVLKAVADKRALIVDVSDKIFGYAEVGFHEFRTAKLYEEVLKKEGFQVEMGVGGMPTAFKATYGTEKSMTPCRSCPRKAAARCERKPQGTTRMDMDADITSSVRVPWRRRLL